MRSRRYEIDDLAVRARELRQNPTVAEDRLWQALRRKALGVKFRRQAPIGRYIVDFLSIECQLVIEVDGSQHRESAHNSERDSWLRSQGLSILRFWNNQVTDELPAVLTVIDAAIQAANMAPAP